MTRQPARPGTGVSTRGSAPVAVVLLVGLCVLLAAGVGTALTSPDLPSQPRYVSIEGEATADGTVRLEHAGGSAIDVRRLDVSVTVGDAVLRYQPPVPFFSARGFYGGPEGPFNSAADPAWTAGELAGFRIAGTNDPPLVPETEVVVRLSIGEQTVAVVEMEVTVG